MIHQQRGENYSPAMSDAEVRVELAAMPSTVVVTALRNQLAGEPGVCPQVDYLSHFLDAVSIARVTMTESGSDMESFNSGVMSVLREVGDKIGAMWGADLWELGLDPESPDFRMDLLDLYHVLVSDSQRIAEEALFVKILSERRAWAGRLKREVSKRDQSVAEMRRVLASFDDVTIAIGMPDILTRMASLDDPWEATAETILELIGYELPPQSGSETVVRHWDDAGFSARLIRPMLAESHGRVTNDLKLRWIEITQRPAEPSTERPRP